MDRVTHMDISGAKSLSESLTKILKDGQSVYIVGIKPLHLKMLKDLMMSVPFLQKLRIIDSMTTLQMAVNQVNDLPRTPHIRALEKNFDPGDFESLDRKHIV